MRQSGSTSSLSELQYAFTRHVRDPDHVPAPADVEDRRMGIYRGLLFKNVANFMAQTYPVLKKVLGADRWEALVRGYFRDHRARTPLFPKMPQEFLQYLESGWTPGPDDYPFIRELAHYEWVELALSLDAREIEMDGIDAQADLLDGAPVLNPLTWPLAYAYPVHRISPDYLPEAPGEQPTYLVVYRDRRDKVGFLELNPVSARLVELLQKETGRTGRELLEQIAGELRHPNPAVVVDGGRAMLDAMRGQDIVLGVRAG